MKKARKFLALALAGVMTLSLAACGGSSSSDSSSSSDTSSSSDSSSSDSTTTASSGGTFTFGCNYFSEYLDPTVNDNSCWQGVRLGVTETLFAFDADGNVYENLCDSYETDDYITWVLHIREGVYFSNGKELTASEVVAAFDLYYAAEEESGTVLQSQYLPNATFTADDEAGTVTVVCESVTSNLRGILGHPRFAIIDADEFESQVVDSVIGTGPYALESYVEANSKTFVKNEYYWGGDVPYDGYTALYIDDSSTKAMSIQSGSVDVVENVTTSSDLETLEADSTYTVVSTAGVRLANTYLNFNGVLANDSLRQAIMMAIDDETICNVTVGGIYTAGCSVIPSSLDYGYDELTDPYTYDIEAAEALLDEAGIVDTNGDGWREIDGEEFELLYYVYESRSLEVMAEAVATILESIGINVNYTISDYDTILGIQKSNGTYDMVTANTLVLPTGDPSDFLSNWYSGNSSQFGNYVSDEYDALYEELTATTDEDARKEIMVEMQQILIDDCATIVHGYYNSSMIYNNTVMTGIEMYPLDYTWVTTDWAPVG